MISFMSSERATEWDASSSEGNNSLQMSLLMEEGYDRD